MNYRIVTVCTHLIALVFLALSTGTLSRVEIDVPQSLDERLKVELYNLDSDLSEKSKLSNNQSSRVAELTKLLLEQ